MVGVRRVCNAGRRGINDRCQPRAIRSKDSPQLAAGTIKWESKEGEHRICKRWPIATISPMPVSRSEFDFQPLETQIDKLLRFGGFSLRIDCRQFPRYDLDASKRRIGFSAFLSLAC